jgi:hypothetical protein
MKTSTNQIREDIELLLESKLTNYTPRENIEIERLLGKAKYLFKRIEYEGFNDRYKEIKRII